MGEDVRGGIDEAGADDVFDEVAIVEGAYLADDEAGGEEDGAEDVEARQAPALVFAGGEVSVGAEGGRRPGSMMTYMHWWMWKPPDMANPTAKNTGAPLLGAKK